MVLNFGIVNGIMCGFEFIYDDEDDLSWLFIDIFIIRIMIGWK